MKIICNHLKPTHRDTISGLLRNADEVILCIAFLKNSGLRGIIGKLPENCVCYIGTDYYLTEPAALRQLMDKGVTVYLTNAVRATFHPKVYYIRHGDELSILVGSANLTGGGLETNLELSVLLAAKRGTRLDKDFRSVISHYAKHSTRLQGEAQLSQYERDFEAYRQKHKKADREFQEERADRPRLNLDKIEVFFKRFLNSDGEKLSKKRRQRYRGIKKMLDKLADTCIASWSEFLEYWEPIAKAFYSSDLLRGKTTYARGYKRIISAIRYIREHQHNDAGAVYEGARRLILPVSGFGVNMLTEIMATYNPLELSVANGRTLSSLERLGLGRFPRTLKQQFDQAQYVQYNNLIKDIAVRCKAKDLGQVDHFLSWYYDQYGYHP